MATVYLAEDLKHHRRVAIKVLDPELAAALGPERFLKEIELTANLQHPHILPLFDSGAIDGMLYYVMPFVDGESLTARLRRETQLPVDDAVRIATEVASALEYAHRRGVIHRDIKPDNILFHEGRALVADFGIALVASTGERATATGMSVGTPSYMSPEQALAERNLTPQSDIYALGVVTYEMLAGEPPFSGPSAQAIMARVIAEPPRSLRIHRPGVPQSIESGVLKSLEKVPADRFATASDFARAIATTGDNDAVSRASAPRRRIPHAVSGLLLAGVLVIGTLFAWRKSWNLREKKTPARVLAVLPFTNIGDSSDAYFADGVTDAVRGKLSLLRGLDVIAGESSNEYRQSHKPLRQIAQELGASYLLTAKLRWAVSPDGTKRMELNPELVDAAEGHPPRVRWSEPFGAKLTDVFQVQADIAGRVANALDVVLGDSIRQQFAQRPTQNFKAYDLFLRGQELFSAGDFTQGPMRRAAQYYEQAIALDSNFVEAWAGSSRAHSLIYANSIPLPADSAASHHAAERARHLKPSAPDGYLSLGDYYAGVKLDPALAAEAYLTGLRIAPRNADLLMGVAGAEVGLGRFDSALAHYTDAASLNPRSVPISNGFAYTLFYLRRYPEAAEAYDRAIAVAPTVPNLREERAMVELGRGDLSAARRVIAAAPPEIERDEFLALVAMYGDLFWLLTDAQQVEVLRFDARPFGNDRAGWALVQTQILALRGDTTPSRAFADSSRHAIEQQLRLAPDDPGRHMGHALALAYLGQPSAAINEARRTVAQLPVSKNAWAGAYLRHQLARIYIMAGEHEKALDEIEYLLSIPYVLSPGWLRIDPAFAPLRGNPRFERLLH